MDNGSTGVPQFEVPHQPNQYGGNAVPQNPNYMPQPAASEILPPAGNVPGASMPPQQMPPQQMPAQQYQQPPMVAAPLQTQPPITASLMAEDTDLIEKEWVDKAKEIVERTRHDPYLQNREITKMKADYMKKRYNKDIRIPEE